MKGFTRDHKFIPMTDYKKVTRKSRDSKTMSEGIRLRRDKKIPVYNTKVNWDNKRKPFKMWIVKHPEGSDVVKGSVTIVMAEHYGQAIDDYITIWNKENRMNRKIGYPVVQGTADKSFRYKRDTMFNRKRVRSEAFNEIFKNPQRWDLTSEEVGKAESEFLDKNTSSNDNVNKAIKEVSDQIEARTFQKTFVFLSGRDDPLGTREQIGETGALLLEEALVDAKKEFPNRKVEVMELDDSDNYTFVHNEDTLKDLKENARRAKERFEASLG